MTYIYTHRSPNIGFKNLQLVLVGLYVKVMVKAFILS